MKNKNVLVRRSRVADVIGLRTPSSLVSGNRVDSYLAVCNYAYSEGYIFDSCLASAGFQCA